MTFPNILTLMRIILAPVVMALFLSDDENLKIVSLVIIILCEISDMLDGYLARKFNQVTNLGKLLDPMADNLFHFSAFLCFLMRGYAEIWMVALIFYRETIVAWIRVIAASEKCIIGARLSGKIKAWVQGTTVISVVFLICLQSKGIIGNSVDIKAISFYLMCLVTLVTLVSGIDYFLKNLASIHTSFNEKPIQGKG